MENEEKRSDDTYFTFVYVPVVIVIITLIVHFVSQDIFVQIGKMGMMIMFMFVTLLVIMLICQLTGVLPPDKEYVQNYKKYDGVTTIVSILTLVCGILLSVLAIDLFSDQFLNNFGIVLIVLINVALGLLGWLIITKRI